jgi:outer membrane protein OmpA-like peptidoglycan-associated protein
MSSPFFSAALQCVFIVSACSFHGLVTAADADKAKSGYGIAKPLGDTFSAPASTIDATQSQLVIYRAPSAADSGIVSLYLGDKYHVALQSNAFSSVCLDNDTVDLRTRLTQPAADQAPAPDTRLSLPLKKASAQYVRISHRPDGRTQLEPVATRVALDELKDARQQMHTLSRAPVVRPCKPVKTKTAETPQPYVITFSADMAFRDKKTSLQTVTPESKNALDQVLEKINKKYADATQVHIHLVGYADDTHDEPANLRLSLARAQAVQSYLLQNGIRPQELSVESRGSQDPLRVTNTNTNPSGIKKKVEIEVKVAVK